MNITINFPRHTRKFIIGMAVVMAAILSGGAAACEMAVQEFQRAWQGVPATMTTYDQNGTMIDRVKGQSFNITLDKRFDRSETDSQGNTTTVPGDVMLISLGDAHINHVGSTMILAQDGLVEVAGGQTKVDIVDSKPGVPWLNNLLEYNRNLWKGKSKTIMIRSQDGKPIAVFGGDSVELVGTSIPKSTWFNVDGKYLFVYRADYTVYDNSLLLGGS